VADPAKLQRGGVFDLPVRFVNHGVDNVLGAPQQESYYPVQYTLGGGNVSITAGMDIAHFTKNTAGQLVPDSERELPMNWLYRRGNIDPLTGEFGVALNGDVASTTWWVDFANFFEGVGALGGGNVTLTAGRDVSNVDAVAPTNARMAKGVPDPSTLLELGGGDITIRAGRDIDGGVYYVERSRRTARAHPRPESSAAMRMCSTNTHGWQPRSSWAKAASMSRHAATCCSGRWPIHS
jgi:hypothetical protein